MGDVLRPDFKSQVVHAVDPSDEDWTPVCEARDVAFVADIGSTLRAGHQWCPACVRVLGRRR